MPTLLLIDGNPIMHRAFHAIPPFKTKTGTPTNVIYGFFSMLYKAVVDFNPDYLIVCFDTPKPTFRSEIFPQYQAQRPKIADEFVSQIPLVKQGLKQAGIFYLERDGVEADDLIGSISKKTLDSINQVLILTGDKDLLQLVNKKVFVISPQTSLVKMIIYDPSAVEKKLAVPPHAIPDLKALIGDPSDNYPGAKGIGPKTATKLINRFGSIENIYHNLDKIDDKLRQLLEKNRDNVFLSKRLATIITNLPLKFNFDQSRFSGFKLPLKNYFLEFEMYSLASRLFKQPKAVVKATENNAEEQIGLF